MDELVKKIGELISGDTGTYVIAGIIALVVLLALWKLLTRRKPEAAAPPDLRIDVTALGTEGPPAGGPSLELYNTPVRLAAIVLAPAGRVRGLPPIDRLDDAFDAIVPGLARVVAAHRPLLRKWPPQLSTRGFANIFFTQARLPGDGGRGTPWSSAAGVLKLEGQTLMAGMVLRTESTGSHGQEIIESPEGWLRILQVKGA